MFRILKKPQIQRFCLKVKGPCYYCNGDNGYERAVVKCPRCFWQDGYRICPICAHQIPVERKHLTDGFIWCADCHAVKHIDSKTLKMTPLKILQVKMETIDCILIWVYSFQMCVFFCIRY